MALVYLSVGSNMGDSVDVVERAIEKISSHDSVELLKRGGVYETEPQGEKAQSWFVNTAVSVQTDMTPQELLNAVKQIEKDMGRKDTKRWGPRLIDIDIIFYGRLTISTDTLSIPHRLADKRKFVLKPIADIDPDFEHPLTGRCVTETLDRLPCEGQTMRKISR